MPKPEKRTSVKLIAELLKDRERKSLVRMTFELLYLTVYYMRIPRHYFSRYLFKKERNNITNYFPDRFLEKIKPFFNDHGTREVLENKLYFSLYFNQLNISLPKILLFNSRSLFVNGNEVTKISNLFDFTALLENLFKDNPSIDSVFVKKTSWSYGGDKIYIVSRDQIAPGSVIVSELYTEVIKSEYLFQERVVQHKDMDRLNPSCLNTIRIDTFLDQEGRIEVISAFLRTSITGLHVDNITSGGCGINIDIETGKLVKAGFAPLKASGVKLKVRHPVTDVVFEDFIIPYFNKVKELVVSAASYVPSLRLVGWDVGIGENGPVLIEGNSNYNIAGNDLQYGGYRTNPVFKKVLQEIKLKKKGRSQRPVFY